MYVKITQSGPRRYVQLVESYRDETGRVKKRTVATLGRLDRVSGELDAVINGLLKATGRKALPNPAAVSFDSARSLGDVWALTALWKSLGFHHLRQIFRATRHQIDVEALIRVMVFNRLCDPDSKLGVLRWLETVALPGMETTSIQHQHLLRSMDALIDRQHQVEALLARRLQPLIDQDLSVVFYDLTTIRVEGQAELDDDVRQQGMAKEGLIARQFMLGVVQTAEGLPIYHEVFAGNIAETKTLLGTLNVVLKRFKRVRRLILVADRGLLSLDNLDALQAICLPSGQALEFIMAVPGRRYHEFVALLKPFHEAHCRAARQEVIGELTWNDRRLVIAHNPINAARQTQRRREKIAELETQAAQWADKLTAQDQGRSQRGRKLSDSGAKARFYHAVCEARLSSILKVDLTAELFSYQLDEPAQQRAELMDGKLLLVTQTPDLSAAQIVERYKALADIERGFRVLKSEIEIGPLYHRLPERIQAHAALCFMALILYRVMRRRLKAANVALSPERALETLRRIQYHQIWFNTDQPLTGISTITSTQHEVLDALNIKKPTASRALAVS
jgi:transposase